MALPFWDERISGGQKRTFWRHDQAQEKRRELKAEAASMRSKKKDRPYTPSDQQKIVAEKWQAVVEKRAKPGEV